MKESTIQIGEATLKLYTLNTAIVGTGAAGLNAADRLHSLGQTDIAVVTEAVNAGTSRNTGSDKQTYYKLSLSGKDPDSVQSMAKDLFDGGCVDGDLSLCEAALSSRSFYKLVELGVPFPCNQYGEYVGYKTDHDPYRRATSAGPYTSRIMTECLEAAVRNKQIPILDKLQVIRILTGGGKALGLLCLNLNPAGSGQYVAINCKNIIYATGGPAGIYADSAYPSGHYGATGIALEAGIIGKNLTEWQYGLASIKPHWNVSGSYMQVLPRFVSTNSEGGDEKEFLLDFFSDKSDMLFKIFLKGYQWPFHVDKIDNGSSIIDLLVYLQTIAGRRVFLDFRSNPGDEIDYKKLPQEARDYLFKAEACFGTPIQRLQHLNSPAAAFYQNKGVDLETQPLEIALCAQHNNGGLGVDSWWQTNLQGFFCVGEASGSHGVTRPGGSALNAGQVGATRAAQYIALHGTGDPLDKQKFLLAFQEDILAYIQLGKAISGYAEENVDLLWDNTRTRMSRFGAAIRDIDGIREAAREVRREIEKFSELVTITNLCHLNKAFRLRDVLICQYVVLNAMLNYIEHGGKSRGSALYTSPAGVRLSALLPEEFRFELDGGENQSIIQEVEYRKEDCIFNWRTVRPIPDKDDFFETVWRGYRENRNIPPALL